MSDSVESTATATYSPQRCRELVEHFRDQVLDFGRKLARFPDWEASAMAADPEAHFWAELAGCIFEELVGPPGPDGLAESLRAIQAGDLEPGGLLWQLNRPAVVTDRQKVFDLGHTLNELRKEAAHHAA